MRETGRKWTHVQATVQRNRTQVVSCSNCQQYETYDRCVHTLLAENRIIDSLQYLARISMLTLHSVALIPDAYPGDPLVVILEYALRTDAVVGTSYHALLSVSNEAMNQAQRTRVIVRFDGHSLSSQRCWYCTSCTTTSKCQHARAAEDRLRHLVLVPDNVDGEEFIPRPFHPLPNVIQLEAADASADKERPVSHLQPAPVPFALLPEERPTVYDFDYAEHQLLQCAINTDGQRAQARCACGAMATDTNTVSVQQCIIYDAHRAYDAHIQLYLCPSCQKMSAGPDLSELGLFNLDNRVIVSARLIHKYDVYYTGQEGTFAHFCSMIRTEYGLMNSAVTGFLSETLFRRVWFAFVRLQDFRDSMMCPICGYNPGCIIADGLTLVRQKSKATGEISPPTIPHLNSPTRDWTRPSGRTGGHQLIPDRRLRVRCIQLIDAIAGPPKAVTVRHRRKNISGSMLQWSRLDVSEDEDVDADEDNDAASSSTSIPKNQVGKMAAELANTIVELDANAQPLATAFRHFIKRDVNDRTTRMWLRLLRQVCCSVNGTNQI